jgi:hypothetical protein
MRILIWSTFLFGLLDAIQKVWPYRVSAEPLIGVGPVKFSV